MKTFTRRKFLAEAGKAGALAAAGGAGVILRGCATGKDYDLLVAGGIIYDGSGQAGRPADIGIAEGVIKTMGRIPVSRARKVLSANGLAVAPGFVDIHEHTDERLLVNPRAESSVRQGITTLVSGNCGGSPFPLTDAMAEEKAKGLKEDYGLDLTWKTAAGFFERIDKAGTAVNYCSYVGHGTVRAAAVGYADHAASASEMERMKSMLGDAVAQGVIGLSSGLEYSPGSFGSTEELVELCRVIRPSRGVYATHMRNEQEGILEAIDEAFRIAREAAVRLQISHIKIGYPRNWPKFDELLRRVEQARAEGLEFRLDRYPYVAWATGLDMFFPLWSREGPTEDFIARLSNPALQARLQAEVKKKEDDLGSWDKVLISDVATDKNRSVEGSTVLEAARRAGKTPYEFMRALLIEEKGRVGMITFAMSEDQLRVLLAHPLVGVGSDGGAVAPYGPLSKGKPHPRFYGTFPRVLGKYVREEKLTSLAEMVRKMTAMPAGHLGLGGRGLLKEGFAADITVFDPVKIIDRATWTEPAQYPAGIDHVVVNGVPVVESGEHTGRLPGRVLRRTGDGTVA